MLKHEVLYLAHPVAGDVAENAVAARRWLRWLMLSDRWRTFIAPWIAALDAGADETAPEERARGLRDAVAVAERCDGIVLCGGRVTVGMTYELDAVHATGGWIVDLTSLGVLPPAVLIAGIIDERRRRFAARPPLERRHGGRERGVIDMYDWLAEHAARERGR